MKTLSSNTDQIFCGKYDDIVTSWLTGRDVESSYDLRNHRFSIYQSPIQFDTRKFSFTNRIISAWNSLPDSVVSANTVNTFKNRLDRFWKTRKFSLIGKLILIPKVVVKLMLF